MSDYNTYPEPNVLSRAQEMDNYFLNTWTEIKPDAVNQVMEAHPISAAIKQAGCHESKVGGEFITQRIKIGKGVLIEPGAFIKSPTIIGDGTEVRHGAYIRGNCLIGRNCVVGHVTEVKHTVFLDGAKAGHFAYLGDSILGNLVNLGAGTKLANLRFIKGNISITTPGSIVQTGLRKLGAILGDGVQTGCNSVTSPGTLLGKKSMVIPNTTVVSGYHPDSSLIR